MNQLIFYLVTLFLSTHTLASRSMASLKRVDHMRELMGESYRLSVVSNHEKYSNLEKNVFITVKAQLPKNHKYRASAITRTIIEESAKHGLDPYFVMAVVSGESSFNPHAIGPVGEIGIMQLRLTTGEWMAQRLKLKFFGARTLKDPVINIKLGVAYLAWLRRKFGNQGQLYLAAYNMGPGSVKTALEKDIRPKDYPIHVMKRYLAFYKAL